MSRMTGRCLCGAVRFETGAVDEVDACHCAICRRWAAGPYFAAKAEGIAWQGTAPAVYRSSEHAERGFCAACGTALFYRFVETGETLINPFTLDGLGEPSFGMEVFVDEKPEFYAFAGDRPRRTGAELIAEYMAAQGEGPRAEEESQ
ncbi:GFA family protein [Paralimibaculum aggregatum]|uniref:GFA family protein n=1 Tax=Paralimibaculum aggregatum TaxID=3036245 RepID=A0ABQ6LNV3_9RHOB|nr:GFA family protein [Limibaculum sp. NKW23]GMG84904.1 GFA family protein [Limibaculum sp. NKW23]